MNSGGAQVFQTGLLQMSTMKMKGKGKGANAASLAGTLLAMLPGAVSGTRAFGGMMRQLRGQMIGLGVQPNPKLGSTDRAPGVPRGIARPPVAAVRPRQMGAAKSPVLVFGEATRKATPRDGLAFHMDDPVPPGRISPAAPDVPVGVSGLPGTVSTPAGSGTRLQAPGQLPGKPASHLPPSESVGLPTTHQTRSRKVVLGGAVKSAGSSGEPLRAGPLGLVGKEEVHRGKASMRQPQPAMKAAKPSKLVGSPGNLSQKGLTGKPDVQLLQTAADPKAATRPIKGGQADRGSPIKAAPAIKTDRPRQPRRGPGSRVKINAAPTPAPTRVNGDTKGTVPRMAGDESTIGRLPHMRAPKAGRVRPRANSHAVVERPMNQPRLDGIGVLPNRTVTQAAVPVPGQFPTHKPAVKWQPRSKVDQPRHDGPARIGPLRTSGVEGQTSDPKHSLTIVQDGLRPHSPSSEGKSRGFVNLETVGIHRGGESKGDETPAPLAPSLPSPAPATLASGSLASLARLTALQYSRFVTSDQRNDVFAIDAGSLGKVQLTFQASNAGTALYIVVDSSEVRQMLLRALPHLEQEMAQQGLEFSNVRVAVEDGGREESSPKGGDPASNPAESSYTTDEVDTEDDDSSSARDYGYNTVEFVA